MKKTLAITATTLALLATSGSQAEDFYASVGLGQSSFNNLNKTALASDVLSVDRMQGSQFFVLGYEMTPNWAAEVSYSYLGKFKMDRGVTNANEYSYSSAYSVSAVRRFYPLESAKGLSVSGKLGYASVTIEAQHAPVGTVSPYATSGKGSVLLGVGLEYVFTPSISAGLNYDLYQNFGGLAANLENIHASVKYRF
jgi:opacity protein-like surface antigen